MKFIQTGCTDASEDIVMHRRLMGTGMLEEDRNGLTCPIILSYPASAQLAAAIDNVEIDLARIDEARKALEEKYDIVLIEGAGGLMVPITDSMFSIDYAASRQLPVILVTNSRLGSINHTILSLEAIKHRGLHLEAVLFNTYFDNKDPLIAADTLDFITRYLPSTPIFKVPSMKAPE